MKSSKTKPVIVQDLKWRQGNLQQQVQRLIRQDRENLNQYQREHQCTLDKMEKAK